MKILILGGSRYIGRHIAETLVAAGHAVSVLNRGQSPDELPAQVERLRGDREEGVGGLAALKSRMWDACVDVCGYTPKQVRPSAELLHTNVGRYVFISAVSVYGDPVDRPVFETHPRLPPASEEVTEVNGETYGPLKVTCENIIQEIYGDKAAFLRPQIVVGPHDQGGRFSYWVNRTMQGGEMLAPGDGSDHVQIIDVRDLAQFTRIVIESNLSGSFNLVGHRLAWTKFLEILGAKKLVWVPDPILKSAGVTEFELPLYRQEHGPRSGLMQVNNERAITAGLKLTDPEETVKAMRAWLSGRNHTPLLSREREAELIQLARQAGS